MYVYDYFDLKLNLFTYKFDKNMVTFSFDFLLVFLYIKNEYYEE